MTPGAGADWTTEWTAALDDLELTLTETENLLADQGRTPLAPAAAWTPPQLATPLPPEMLDRARELLARQQQLIAQTSSAMSGNRRTNAFVDKVVDAAGTRRPAMSVYLDVLA
jgi:hypothetical protein